MPTIEEKLISVKDPFERVIAMRDTRQITQFVNDYVDLEMLTQNHCALYKTSNCSLFHAIAQMNNLLLLHDIIHLPKFIKHRDYYAHVAQFITIGFQEACGHDNVEILHMYEQLQCARVSLKHLKDKGLNQKSWYFDNGKLRKMPLYLKKCLEKAIDSEYQEGHIVDFIMSIKDKYHAYVCNVDIDHFINTVPRGQLAKSHQIIQTLNMSYDHELFEQVFKKVTLLDFLGRADRADPALVYLVIEKNIQMTPRIQDLIKDNPEVQRIFLQRQLSNELKSNTMASKHIKI